jgi:arsenate reductase
VVSGRPIRARPYAVLILCTANSARSILGEALVNQLGAGKFQGYSAGSRPAGVVHPMAIEPLREMKFPTDGLRSKSWDEFAAVDAPPLDLVITVCDGSAGEMCPVWPGQPVTAHWGLVDPAAVQGGEVAKRLAFRATFEALESRIKTFVGLSIDSLDRSALKERIDEIGRAHDG